MAQVPCQQRRRGRAVDIVVAEDRDLFSPCRGIRDTLRRGFHLGHGVRIGHQLADGRIEKILHRVNLDIAAGQHPRQHFRQLISLRDRSAAPTPADRAGRATVFPSRIATRRERPAAPQRAMRMQGAFMMPL